MLFIRDTGFNMGHTYKCTKCNDTGFLFGAQDWSEKAIKKHGGPYYTAHCDCPGATEKRKQFNSK